MITSTSTAADDVLLRDGRIVQVREVAATDREQLIDLHEGLSEHSSYLRFFELGRATGRAFVDRLLTAIDSDEAAAEVVLQHDRVIGVGCLFPLTADRGEFALVVADDLQGYGVGTLLLERLADLARRRQITELVAEVLSGNTEMLRLMRESGFELSLARDHETVRARLPVRLTERLIAAMITRERTADGESVRRLLSPASVAVIGASRRPGAPGHQVLRNLTSGGFNGPVYPINIEADEVAGIPAYHSVRDVPGPIDLAVIAVRASSVLEVIDQCIECKVSGAVILSSGFAEHSPEGRRLQDEVLRTARAGDMRIVGPNCLGIANTDAAIRLNATFAETPCDVGNVGLVTQSGGVGIAMLQRAKDLGTGLSSFVSAGNKIDISGNDMLMFYDEDSRTDVVALYLESFGNPRKFSRLARHVGTHKPVVALVGGASKAGRRAAAGHTAAAVTSNDAVDALFGQCGVIRTSSLEHFLQVTSLLSHQPLPNGRRAVIIGNGGGPCVLAADACIGVDLAELTEATRSALRTLAPAAASVANPVDLGAGVTADQFAESLTAVANDPGVDMIIVVHTPVAALDDADFEAAVADAADLIDKTIVAVMLGAQGGRHPILAGDRLVPVMGFPEDAARALAPIVRYAEWRRTSSGLLSTGAEFGKGSESDVVRSEEARRLVTGQLAGQTDGRWLDAEAGRELLACYGIEVDPVDRAADVRSAVDQAERLGYPVVMKTADPSVVHKSAAGLIRLHLADAEQVEAAYRALTRDAAGAVLLQHQVDPGLELIAGVTQDDVFGPLVMFGRGGIDSELIADRVFRLTPLTEDDAATAVRSLRSSPLLTGSDRAVEVMEALQDVLIRIGRLADDMPVVSAIDLNPIIVGAHGLSIVDAKVQIHPRGETIGPMLPRLRPASAIRVDRIP
ncbi:MAG TPA: GNAT family N-acetyltransferase [Microlunatus sp.]